MTNLSYDPRYAFETYSRTFTEAVVHSALVENLDRCESLDEVAKHVVNALTQAGLKIEKAA